MKSSEEFYKAFEDFNNAINDINKKVRGVKSVIKEEKDWNRSACMMREILDNIDMTEELKKQLYGSPEDNLRYILPVCKERIEAIKFDEDKPSMSLVPPKALQEVAKVFTFGAKKYGEDNWRKGFKYRRLLSAGMRHRNAFNCREDLDEETGLCHLAHSIACDMMLLEQYLKGFGEDDRYV
jgi:hypothetical protein